MTSTAATTNAAQHARNVRPAKGAPISTRVGSARREADGRRTANGGKCGERETGREPWRLNRKEVRNGIGNVISNRIGNVKEGRRNMPEILSPRRG
ncbi:hypothetical protein [Paraburkholderia phenoliruptrix]|uniref:hypothetical protein n=1 Tax=Paraburkholderia phenoliruptrix TaxID=252970 RepID=UPI003D96729A